MTVKERDRRLRPPSWRKRTYTPSGTLKQHRPLPDKFFTKGFDERLRQRREEAPLSEVERVASSRTKNIANGVLALVGATAIVVAVGAVVTEGNEPLVDPAATAGGFDFTEGQLGGEFKPVLAAGNDAATVLDQIFTNCERALSELNQNYLQYCVADLSSPLAQAITNLINSQSNHYPVEFTTTSVEDLGRFDRPGGPVWRINYMRDINGLPDTEGVPSFEPHQRTAELVLATFANSDASTGQIEYTTAWVIKTDAPSPTL